jgi:thioesterase domain-containing protein
VTDTLQAAIADPDVAARLGRLEKAERWSGFGDFGSVTAVSRGSERRETPLASQPVSAAPNEPDDDAIEAARALLAVASAEVDTAETALREARASVVDRRGKVATARRRYEKILETLSAAEREVETAEAAADAAEQSAEGAAARLATAKDELAHAERALDASE